MNKIKHQCPFCGEWVEHYEGCNGFCECFAKYYSQQKIWLNRKTGETVKENDIILKQAIDFYGEDTQLNICIEELSELIKELCKAKRGIANIDNISEEMADVKIILKSLDMIFNNTDKVNEQYKAKMQRLKTRLDNDKKSLEEEDNWLL